MVNSILHDVDDLPQLNLNTAHVTIFSNGESAGVRPVAKKRGCARSARVSRTAHRRHRSFLPAVPVRQPEVTHNQGKHMIFSVFEYGKIGLKSIVD